MANTIDGLSKLRSTILFLTNPLEYAAKKKAAGGKKKKKNEPNCKNSQECNVGGKKYCIPKGQICGGKQRKRLDPRRVEDLRKRGGTFEGYIGGKKNGMKFIVTPEMLAAANKLNVSQLQLEAGRVPTKVQSELRKKFNQMTIGDSVTKIKPEKPVKSVKPAPKPEPKLDPPAPKEEKAKPAPNAFVPWSNPPKISKETEAEALDQLLKARAQVRKEYKNNPFMSSLVGKENLKLIDEFFGNMENGVRKGDPGTIALAVAARRIGYSTLVEGLTSTTWIQKRGQIERQKQQLELFKKKLLNESTPEQTSLSLDPTNKPSTSSPANYNYNSSPISQTIVYTYTTEAFRIVNKKLRSTDPKDWDEEAKALAWAVENSLAEMPRVAPGTVVYRGLSRSKPLDPGSNIPGEVLFERSVTSTSSAQEKAEAFMGSFGKNRVFYTVTTKENSAAASIEHISAHPREKEVAFPPQTQFRIKKNEYIDGVTYIEMDEV